MKQLTVAHDNRGIPVYGLLMNDETWTAALAADTDTTLAVPEGARFALLAGDDHYYVSLAAITLPVPAFGFSAQLAEQDKQIIYFEGGAGSGITLHFRSRNTCFMSVSFFT